MEKYIGKKINGFVLVEKLGEGGFGVVFKVEDCKTLEKLVFSILFIFFTDYF